MDDHSHADDPADESAARIVTALARLRMALRGGGFPGHIPGPPFGAPHDAHGTHGSPGSPGSTGAHGAYGAHGAHGSPDSHSSPGSHGSPDSHSSPGSHEPRGLHGTRGNHGHGPYGRHGHGSPGHRGDTRGRHGPGPFGRSIARFRLLETLMDAGSPLTVTVIAERLGVDQPRASKLVQSAVDVEHVRREADPGDARRTLIVLTESGRALVGEARGARLGAAEQALAGFSAEERAQLAELLTRLADGWPR